MSDAAVERSKPSDPAKLTLEAWSQGFMVGALLIMCGITVANMRRGVLLHKLILIEVSQNIYLCIYTCTLLSSYSPCKFMLTDEDPSSYITAHPSCPQWLLHLLRPPAIWLVPLRHSGSSYIIMDATQHHRLDEE